MAVLRLDLDNILCFNGFSTDFSYPKKLVNTSLEGEYFVRFPKIRYRKVNVIVGSNASGKTSLGRALLGIFRFLNEKEANNIYSLISSEEKRCSILMDCAFSNGLFFRVEIKKEARNEELLVRLRSLQAEASDTYESLVAKLDDNKPFENYVKALDQFEFGGSKFSFPSIEDGFDLISCKYDEKDKKQFCDIYREVLTTMDSSIKDVYPSAEIPDSYVIVFRDKDAVAVTHKSKLSSIRRLSSGTKYAVNIAGVIYSIKKHKNGFYFVDEQFSYVNSDIEIACLTKMISLLDDGEQLFFTTHNTELLSLPLPNHAFNFIRKTQEGGDDIITWTNAAAIEKRNNVNIKNLYDNDFFGVSPDVNKILNIAED
ncbi:MAG: AAA family ATPase [Bacilli bacterium]|nr:AAA family ATPase [Bacilli bacterium]